MRTLAFRPTVIAVCWAASLLPAGVAISQNAPANDSTADDESRLAGTWRGDSLWVEKGTACHDEIAVYRIAAIPRKRGYLLGILAPAGKAVHAQETPITTNT